MSGRHAAPLTLDYDVGPQALHEPCPPLQKKSRSAVARLPLKHLLYKLPALEKRQVSQLLPRPDKPRRHIEFILNRNHATAFSGAVELRHDESRELRRLMKLPRLVQRVAARCRIDHEQAFMRCRLVTFRKRAFHLRKFTHEIRFRMQPARSVAEQEFDILTLRALI